MATLVSLRHPAPACAERLDLHPVHLDAIVRRTFAGRKLGAALRCVYCPICVVHSTRVIPGPFRSSGVIPWICDPCWFKRTARR
jgi:hypothetical protein